MYNLDDVFFMNDGGNTSIWNQLSQTSILEALLKLRKCYLKCFSIYKDVRSPVDIVVKIKENILVLLQDMCMSHIH